MAAQARRFAGYQFVMSFIAVCGLLMASMSAMAASRVALVTLGEDEKVLAALELATVDLSRDADIELLERDRIRAVLGEQQFSLKPGSLDEGAIVIGRLLQADVLFVCEQVDNGASIRCVAYEAASGCRLTDSSEADAPVPKLAAQIARLTRESLAKQARFEKVGLQLISFHERRNVDLPPSQLQSLARIQTTLEQAFAKSPNIAVLERARLGFVNDEHRLPTALRQARLLAAATNVAIQFAKPESGPGVEVSLVLRENGSGDEQIFRQIVKESTTVVSVAKLVDQVAKAIAPKSGKVSRNDLIESTADQSHTEAALLRVEAKRLQKAKEWSDAVIFFEAAHALEPEQHDDLENIIGLLDKYADSLLHPIDDASTRSSYVAADFRDVWNRALRLLEYRLELILLLHERRKDEPQWITIVSRGAGGGGWPPWHESGYAFEAIRADATPDVFQRANAYTNRYFEVLFGTIGKYVRHRVQSPEQAADCMTMYLPRHYRQMAVLSGHWPQLVFEHFDEWHALFQERNWSSDNPLYDKANYTLLRMMDFSDYQLQQFDEQERIAVRERVAQFAECQSASLRHAAQFRLIQLDTQFGGLNDKEEIARRVEKLIDESIPIATRPLPLEKRKRLPNQLLSGEPFPGDRRRQNSLYFLGNLVVLHPDSNQAADKVFSELLKHGVFSDYILNRVMPPYVYEGRIISAKNLPERIERYRGTLTQLESSRKSFPSVDYERIAVYLTTEMAKEQALLDKHRGVFRGMKLWSTLELLEGIPEWPNDRNESPRVVGFHIDGHKLFYLTRTPSSPDGKFELRLKQVALSGEHDSAVLNNFGGQGDYLELAPEIREFADVIYDDSPRRVTCDEQNMYWGRVGFGFVVLPLNGDNPHLLDEESGLPSNFVHCVAATRDRLYAWVGRPNKELLLVSYDPTSRQLDVAVSSERIIRKRPLDELDPKVVKMMYFDEPRNRLVFVYHKSLWSWNLATNDATEILDLSSSPYVGHPRSGLQLGSVVPVPHRNALLVNQGREYWAVDLRQDSYDRLPRAGQPAIYPEFSTPTTWFNNYLLLRSPWGAYDYEANKYVALESLIPGVESPWSSRPWCQTTDDGKQCIIWDSYHLWLAKLNSAAIAERVK